MLKNKSVIPNDIWFSTITHFQMTFDSQHTFDVKKQVL